MSKISDKIVELHQFILGSTFKLSGFQIVHKPGVSFETLQWIWEGHFCMKILKENWKIFCDLPSCNGLLGSIVSELMNASTMCPKVNVQCTVYYLLPGNIWNVNNNSQIAIFDINKSKNQHRSTTNCYDCRHELLNPKVSQITWWQVLGILCLVHLEEIL